MSLTAENDNLPLAPGERGVSLYAGGTTGFVLLEGTGEQTAFWAALAERAEDEGFSALTFVEPQEDAAGAAVWAGQKLERLGVEQLLIVAAGRDAAAALLAAAGGLFAAVVLLDPAIPDDRLEKLLEEVPMPKLVVVVNGDEAQARAIYRRAVGPTVIRHLPTSNWRRGGALFAGEPAELAGEAILGFAVGVCGDGRPA
jgi:hypothetical protein